MCAPASSAAESVTAAADAADGALEPAEAAVAVPADEFTQRVNLMSDVQAEAGRSGAQAQRWYSCILYIGDVPNVRRKRRKIDVGSILISYMNLAC